MPPDEIRAILARHDLSQAVAARLVGVRDTTFQRWCTGAQAITETAARLLLLLDAMPDALDLLRHFAANRPAPGG